MTPVANAIVDCLHTSGWYAGASVLSADLTRQLSERAGELARSGALFGAGTGNVHESTSDSIRGDETQWVADEPEDPSEREALRVLNELRTDLNEALFLGAHDLQVHFARYAPGASYATHRDRFHDDDSRLVSLVAYLNPAWADDAGGELVLYAGDDSGEVLTRVSPREGTMACFLSDRFPHEVLPATHQRYSLTGWLRRLDPALGANPQGLSRRGSTRT